MVNSINGPGPIQGTTNISVSPKQKHNQEKTESSSGGGASDPVDEVAISQKALDLTQAENTARETAKSLQDSNFSLGLNPNFDTEA